MERIKRQQNDIVQDYHGNKKGKWQHQNDNTTRLVIWNLFYHLIAVFRFHLDLF